MALDLEADPPGGGAEQAIADAIGDSSPAETVSTSDAPVTFADPLADQYDFGPPGEDDVPPPPAAAPATPDAAAAAATPEAPAEVSAISEGLRQRAIGMGYTPEFVATFKDPTHLELSVRATEQAATAAFNFARQQQAPQPQQQVQQQAPVQLPPPPVAPPAFDEAAYRQQLKAMNYDDSLAEAMVGQEKKIHTALTQAHAVAVENHRLMTRFADQDRYNTQSHEYMRQADARVAQIQAQHQGELIERDWSDFTKALPKEHQKLVSTPEAKAQIYQMANTILVGLMQSGQQLPPNSTAFKQATNAVLGEKLYQAATETVRSEVRTHQARSTSRPSSAAARPTGGGRGSPEAAGNFVDEFYRQHGMPSSNNGIEV